jgi:metal-responsive CopG/Arc/MetJ family transcriptional regulator
MHTMKTAISVDGHLLHEADQAARQMGLSRSRLFSLALENYLRQRRQEQMIEKLNQVYAGEPNPSDLRTAKRVKAKFRSTITERW